MNNKLNSKDRAKLRSIANGTPAILHLGKEGITPQFTKAAIEALAGRELIKIDILQNCELYAKEAAEIVSSRTSSQVVQIIGRRFVLYKKNIKKKEGIL